MLKKEERTDSTAVKRSMAVFAICDCCRQSLLCLLAVCAQLIEKLRQHRAFIDEVSFDDIADAPNDLKSRWQQLMQFQEKFEVG